MAMSPSGRILTATAAVLFCLALLWVYTSIESLADSNVQSPSKLALPIWATDDEQTAEKLPDDDTPTPALVPNESSSPSDATEIATDPSTSELMEAAYTDLLAQEQKKSDEAPKRSDPLPNVPSNPAGRPADYPVLPKVESPSTEPPSPGNTITSPQEDPAQGSTDLASDVTAQPVPAQVSPPNAPEGTKTSPQPPHALPKGTTTPPDATTPSALPKTHR